MKALLVEDNDADVTLIRLALRDSQAAVELHVVDDGVKALEFLKREGVHMEAPRPDFILLDLKLPRKSGLEVLSEIKRDPELRRIPVIALTSSTAPMDVGRAYDLQAAGYFAKPVTGLEDVLGTIVRFVGSMQLPEDGSGAPPAAARPGVQPTIVYPPLPTESFERLPRETRAAALVDASAEAIVSVSLDGRITGWNLAAEELYGYTEEEALGQHLRLIVQGDELARLSELIHALRGGARGQRLDVRRADNHGRLLDIAISVSPIRDRSGNMVGASLVARDITDRRRREDRFRIAVESSPNAIVMVDAQGTIILVNGETEHLFGYGRDELLGRSIEVLVPERFRRGHPGHRQGFMAAPMTRVMGAGRDLYGLRKDGSEFPVEIGLRPIDTSDGTVVMSAIVDITERKRTEEQLARQTAELARSNAELEQFAYVASHDLQEPLRTVASYTELLERRYAAQLDDTARTYLRYAREGAVRMQDLIDALLAYGRIGTRGRTPVPTPAGAALDQALENLATSIEESGTEIVRGELPTIAADPTQLAELFQNLIGNAIKFRGPERPRITIAARLEGREWEFTVADNGIGIDAQYFDRIFEVFQRLHTREEYRGVGIGLAICKRIVERLGGRIGVESAPGKGATFFFTVPASRGEPAVVAAEDAG